MCITASGKASIVDVKCAPNQVKLIFALEGSNLVMNRGVAVRGDHSPAKSPRWNEWMLFLLCWMGRQNNDFSEQTRAPRLMLPAPELLPIIKREVIDGDFVQAK